MRRRAVAAVLGGVLVASCARADTLGPQEAIEVMVLDGVPRERAVCVVTTLDDALPLEKITGLDPALSDDELALLATATGGCTPALTDTGGTVGGDATPGLDPIAALADRRTADPRDTVNAVVDELVLGGLDPDVGSCLGQRMLGSDDPAAVAASDERLAELIELCAPAAPSEGPVSGTSR